MRFWWRTFISHSRNSGSEIIIVIAVCVFVGERLKLDVLTEYLTADMFDC